VIRKGFFERALMFIEEDEIRLLEDVGFTKTQAKLYMTLLGFEETDGRTISAKAKIPRQEVYRTLDELEKKGLVEKVISSPYKFKATPLDLGLQILIDKRIQHCKEIQVKTKKFLRKHQADEKNELSKPEYELIMVEGRQRLMQLMKRQHETAERKVRILTTLPRWLQILNFCFENYEEALSRGVKYQVVLEAQESEIGSRANIHSLLKSQNFELRLTGSPLDTNAAIFDDREVTVNFFLSQSLAESPLVWTNHPSFISMCRDHFTAIWNSNSQTSLSTMDYMNNQLTH
jgi:sugar-specific transcriptional regulator TrmB